MVFNIVSSSVVAAVLAVAAPAAFAADAATVDQQPADQWRASKLSGVTIYGPDRRSVGKVSDVLMTKDGKASFIVIGVGGFLGLGEKDVAVPYEQVRFTSDPIVPPANPAPSQTLGGSGAAPAPSMAAAPHTTAYPDHGTIDMTADQLKAAPTFHFSK